MARSRSSLFLLPAFITIAVSFRGRGYIELYECSNRWCTKNCHLTDAPRMTYFGYCQRDIDFPGTGLIKDCYTGHRGDGDRVVARAWANEDCSGEPTHIAEDYGCRLNVDGTAYTKLHCYKWEVPIRGGLKSSTQEKEESKTDNMPFGFIFLVLLSIVCIIGIVVGYLMQRKRKNNAQIKLLYEQNICIHSKTSSVE